MNGGVHICLIKILQLKKHLHLNIETPLKLKYKIVELIRNHFELRPKGLIQMLGLLRPIYRQTAAYGHFGREEPTFTWEQTDKAAALKSDARL